MKYSKQDPDTIRSLFDKIANGYDQANQYLSLNLHSRWTNTLVSHLINSVEGKTFLDLCAGTGDVAYAYLKRVTKPIEITLVDFSSNMLRCAEKKINTLPNLSQHSISYLTHDVHTLPFPNQSIDLITMAYGIRNLPNPKQAIQEMSRIIKPGGLIGILELTKPILPVLSTCHRYYLQWLAPLIGKWITDDREAYEYLRSSIEHFKTPSELINLFQTSYPNCSWKKKALCGGIATLIIGNSLEV